MNTFNLVFKIILSFLIAFALSMILSVKITLMLTPSNAGFAAIMSAFMVVPIFVLIIGPLTGIIFLIVRKINWFISWRNTALAVAGMLLIFTTYGGWYQWEHYKERTKLENQEKQKQDKYQELINRGYYNKPKYLPTGHFPILQEQKRDLMDGNHDILGYEVTYSCNSKTYFVLQYIPIDSFNQSKIEKRIAGANDNYSIKIGQVSFEKIAVNGKLGYYETYTTGKSNSMIAWKTSKSLVSLTAYGDCDLTKEEMIKIAESVY